MYRVVFNASEQQNMHRKSRPAQKRAGRKLPPWAAASRLQRREVLSAQWRAQAIPFHWQEVSCWQRKSVQRMFSVNLLLRHCFSLHPSFASVFHFAPFSIHDSAHVWNIFRSAQGFQELRQTIFSFADESVIKLWIFAQNFFSCYRDVRSSHHDRNVSIDALDFSRGISAQMEKWRISSEPNNIRFLLDYLRSQLLFRPSHYFCVQDRNIMTSFLSYRAKQRDVERRPPSVALREPTEKTPFSGPCWITQYDLSHVSTSSRNIYNSPFLDSSIGGASLATFYRLRFSCQRYDRDGILNHGDSLLAIYPCRASAVNLFIFATPLARASA